MTKKEEERELNVLETARILEEGMRTKFWDYLNTYFLVRIAGLKNELAKIDLQKEVMKAAKTQGKIDFAYSIGNRIKNVIKEAEMIRKKRIKKKEK